MSANDESAFDWDERVFEEQDADAEDAHYQLTPAQEQALTEFLRRLHRVDAAAPEGALIGFCLRCGFSGVGTGRCPTCDGSVREEERA